MKKIAQIIGIVILVAIAIVIPFLLTRVFALIMKAAEQQALATWSQTLGVIIAIFTAVFITRNQFKKLNDAANTKKDDRIKKIAALVDVAFIRSQKIKEAVQKKSPVDNLNQVYDRLTMESLRMALNQVPVYELANSAAIESFFSISDQISFLAMDCEVYKNGFFNDNSIKAQRDELFYKEIELANMRTVWETAMNSNIATRCRIIKKSYDALSHAMAEMY